MAVIPTKNPKSLIAYYLGFVALLPFIGLVFAFPAIVFGVLALKDLRQNPEIQGGGHARVGIVLAVFSLLIWGGILLLIMAAALLEG